MMGAKADKPVAAVYPIMFVEPRLSGGTLFSAIRNPTFYQAPILPTKMLFAMYMRMSLGSSTKIKIQ